MRWQRGSVVAGERRQASNRCVGDQRPKTKKKIKKNKKMVLTTARNKTLTRKKTQQRADGMGCQHVSSRAAASRRRQAPTREAKKNLETHTETHTLTTTPGTAKIQKRKTSSSCLIPSAEFLKRRFQNSLDRTILIGPYNRLQQLAVSCSKMGKNRIERKFQVLFLDRKVLVCLTKQ